jgi:hypothetical protein
MGRMKDYAMLCGNLDPEEVLNEEDYDEWLKLRENFLDSQCIGEEYEL